MRDPRFHRAFTPAAEAFTARINGTTSWVRAQPNWLIRALVLIVLVLVFVLLFAVVIPLAVIGLIGWFALDLVNRVRRGLHRLTRRAAGDAVDPDDQGRQNVRVREPR